MRIPPAALPLLAVFALAACGGNKPEEVDNRAPDPMADQLKNAAPVALPPAVEASVTFRCKDNSLVYLDIFQGRKLANLRTAAGGTPINLTAPAAGEAYTGNGYTVKGDAKTIQYTAPGKAALSCKA